MYVEIKKVRKQFIKAENNTNAVLVIFCLDLLRAMVFCIFSENVRLISLFQVQGYDIVLELIIQKPR